MKRKLQDILALEDVQGIIFLSDGGSPLFSEYFKQTGAELNDFDWSLFVQSFTNIREAELVFSNNRILYRKTESGQIIIIIGWRASIAMIRMEVKRLFPSHPPL